MTIEVALIAMAITTTVTSGIALYLYRWRRIIVSEQALFVPEELVLQLRGLRAELSTRADDLSIGTKATTRQVRGLGTQVDTLASAVSDVLKASATWQNALDERDAEIKRLRAGYDLEIFRRFILRFVKVKTTADEFVAGGDFSSRALHQVSRLLDDAIEECGVERFFPSIGDDYRTAAGVDDNPRVVSTDDPNESFRIVDVLSPGYRSILAGDRNVIVPARVSISIHKN